MLILAGNNAPYSSDVMHTTGHGTRLQFKSSLPKNLTSDNQNVSVILLWILSIIEDLFRNVFLGLEFMCQGEYNMTSLFSQ